MQMVEHNFTFVSQSDLSLFLSVLLLFAPYLLVGADLDGRLSLPASRL